MKKLLFIIMLMSLSITAQNKYITKTGSVSFEASVPSFEEVSAKNNAVTAILNSDNGEFAALILIKGFRFKNALMEEHFNENYAESDLYPKAIFKGKIEGYSKKMLDENNNSFKIKGTLSFHGKTKQTENITMNLSKKENTITCSGLFALKASEFDIKIPKIVRNKIAEDVEVTFNFNLQKK